MPTFRYRRVRESHPMVWEGLGGPPCFPGWVGSPTWRSVRDQKDHQEVREGLEAHPEVREGSRGPPRGPGGIRSPTRRFGRGWETHPKVRERSVDTSGGVGMPILWSRMGRECHPKV